MTIGESAVITAHIRAASVSVAGKVSGDIVATQRIEIRPSAKVSGNITAPVLSVQEGAQFEGHCSMQPEGMREDRKVTVFPKEERVAQAWAGRRAEAGLIFRAVQLVHPNSPRSRFPMMERISKIPAGETP